MIPKKYFKLLVLSILTLILSACVDRIEERSGAEIQIVPVTYALSLSIKAGKKNLAWDELNEYVEQHWDKVSRQAVKLTWYTDSGKSLASDYHAYLLKKGLNRTQLQLIHGATTNDGKFDLEFQTIVHKVVVETCRYEKVGSIDSSELGCYSEGARWQSMVNPEKMLSTN